MNDKEVGTFRVVNLEKFQHYKDRCPPWIKMHASILSDYKFSCLQDASKWHLIAIWLLASRTNNELPMDLGWLGKQIGASSKVDLAPLFKYGFIEQIQALQSAEHSASNALASCQQNADSEKRRVEERRDRGVLAPDGSPIVEREPRELAEAIATPGLNADAFRDWIAYRKSARKALPPASLKRCAEKLAKLGKDQAVSIADAIAFGYTGFFPPKPEQYQQRRQEPHNAYASSGPATPEQEAARQQLVQKLTRSLKLVGTVNES